MNVVVNIFIGIVIGVIILAAFTYGHPRGRQDSLSQIWDHYRDNGFVVSDPKSSDFVPEVCWIDDGEHLGCVRFARPEGKSVCNSTGAQCVTLGEFDGSVCNEAHTACVRWVEQ